MSGCSWLPAVRGVLAPVCDVFTLACSVLAPVCDIFALACGILAPVCGVFAHACRTAAEGFTEIMICRAAPQAGADTDTQRRKSY